MTDDVLCVRFSPDGKLLAVSLLDATVKARIFSARLTLARPFLPPSLALLPLSSGAHAARSCGRPRLTVGPVRGPRPQVFFADTLKFFLSLYGHKLPVLSMDISSDGTLLASGSADKNIKVWGLDFGDCHRSIRAHDDSVMAVQFVPNTHYLFSASKDRTVKYWDADKFEALLTLDGHLGMVWCLAVGAQGEFVVTGGSDRSLRRWERTEEAFFVEEERERRLEGLFAQGLEDGPDPRARFSLLPRVLSFCCFEHVCVRAPRARLTGGTPGGVVPPRAEGGRAAGGGRAGPGVGGPGRAEEPAVAERVGGDRGRAGDGGGGGGEAGGAQEGEEGAH